MNAVNLIGRITKEPELRTSSGGKSYVAFTLAVNEFAGGNQFTQFIPCFAWEKTAENMVKYVKKGAQIAVEGSMNVRQDNNNNQFNTIITVRASRVEFLGTSTSTSTSTNKFAEKDNANINNNQNYDFDLIDDSKPSIPNDDAILWDD